MSRLFTLPAVVTAWVILALTLPGCGGGTEGTGVVGSDSGTHPSGATGTETPGAEPGDVCGRLTGSSGVPVAHLPVSASSGESTETNELGSFSLTLADAFTTDVNLVFGSGPELVVVPVTVPPTGASARTYHIGERTLTTVPCINDSLNEEESSTP